jgi:hypothetical protein
VSADDRDPDRILAEARDPLGRRRFYPPGEHPATARWRKQLAWYREQGLDDSHPMIAYILRTLAVFELGEERAKREYLAAAMRR